MAHLGAIETGASAAIKSSYSELDVELQKFIQENPEPSAISPEPLKKIKKISRPRKQASISLPKQQKIKTADWYSLLDFKNLSQTSIAAVLIVNLVLLMIVNFIVLWRLSFVIERHEARIGALQNLVLEQQRYDFGAIFKDQANVIAEEIRKVVAK